MNLLSPKEAARIASHVYVIRDNADMGNAADLAASAGLNDLFDINGARRTEGTSGPLLIKKRSGFGYLAQGVGGRQGEILIALRGTVDARDWLTDGNIGLQRGPSGWAVHGGFNDTFNSLREDIDRFMRGRNPSVVHCIGHSLGGALATLAADHLSENGTANVRLYTFGCPRVGVAGFARHLSEKIGNQNIQRVFHTADPVSMIPIFPYLHAPVDGQICPLQWKGASVSPAAHFVDNYVKAITNSASWNGLRRSPEPNELVSDISAWLDNANGSAVMLSATSLWMISRALRYLLKKAMAIVAGSVLTGAVTLIDQIAWLLTQGAQASQRLGEEVGSLVRHIFRFLGRPLQAGVALTTGFLRWVLDMLFSTLMGIARRAIQIWPRA